MLNKCQQQGSLKKKSLTECGLNKNQIKLNQTSKTSDKTRTKHKHNMDETMSKPGVISGKPVRLTRTKP